MQFGQDRVQNLIIEKKKFSIHKFLLVKIRFKVKMQRILKKFSTQICNRKQKKLKMLLYDAMSMF